MPREKLTDITVIRETSDDVLLIKPAGLASERSYGGDQSAVHLLQRMYPEHHVRLPHRLDKVTRGIMVAALSDEAIQFHGQEIREGRWSKFYLARVHQRSRRMMQSLLGEHRAYIRRDGPRAKIVHSGGQPAITTVLAYERAPNRSHDVHLLISIATGRYHQIRAMLANLGSPLVGDDLYGGREGRLYLEHALLRMRDFTTGEQITVFRRDDPRREDIHDRLSDELNRLADGDA
ncbi:MAG: RNA pseudouridine synthase [Phycisphaerales bacterium]|nr:RNA pseudouridine synthase [Phycisphaerales bacterium]